MVVGTVKEQPLLELFAESLNMVNPFFDPSLLASKIKPLDANALRAYGQKNFMPQQAGKGFGQGASLAQGAMGVIGNYMNMANQSLNLNSQIAPSQYDPNSAPTYTAGQAQAEASAAMPQGANGGEILGGALQGASAGSAFGAPGAVVGGVVGALSSVFGGESRAEKQRKEKEAALQRVMAAQQMYNTQDVSFRNQQNQREDYLQRINPYNREYNVYKTRF